MVWAGIPQTTARRDAALRVLAGLQKICQAFPISLVEWVMEVTDKDAQ